VDADRLRAELDAADRLLMEVAPTIRAEQLQAQITQQWVTSSGAAARRKT
jgi:hypothetical protein